MFQSAKELAFKGARKVQNFVIDNATGVATAVGTGVAVASNAVHAALPAGVETEITAKITDIGVIGGLILLVVLAIAGIAWVRRPIH